MTSQGQTCVNTPILDTLRLPVTNHARRVAARMTCTEFPVNDLGGRQLNGSQYAFKVSFGGGGVIHETCELDLESVPDHPDAPG
jgi:hypothetical protein